MGSLELFFLKLKSWMEVFFREVRLKFVVFSVGLDKCVFITFIGEFMVFS